jgi:exodeoxyribonuclease VII small subunit
MKKNINFEAALIRLEEIVATLENGIDELDKVVSLYEEGMELTEYCNTKLVKIENKIEILSEKISKKNPGK